MSRAEPWTFAAHVGVAAIERDGSNNNYDDFAPWRAIGPALDVEAGRFVASRVAIAASLGYQQGVAAQALDPGVSNHTLRHLTLAALVEWYPRRRLMLAAGAGLAIEQDTYVNDWVWPSGWYSGPPGGGVQWRPGVVGIARFGIDLFATHRWSAELVGEVHYMRLRLLDASLVPPTVPPAETGVAAMIGVGLRYR